MQIRSDVAAMTDAEVEATKYHHVTTDLKKIPSLDALSDEQLPASF